VLLNYHQITAMPAESLQFEAHRLLTAGFCIQLGLAYSVALHILIGPKIHGTKIM
jgi:hypothetical protein